MTDPVIKIYFRPLQRYTVGARIPSIRIPNTFENRTFSCFVLGWFGFRMVRSSKYTAETDHSKTQLSNMAALSQVILYLYIKRPSLEWSFFIFLSFEIRTKWSKKWPHQPRPFYIKKLYKTTQASLVRFSNGRDQNRTTLNYPNTEYVLYLSPHCAL